MFDYSASELVAGRLLKITLDMLPGAPVVHLEHLGDTNRTWLTEQLARANAKETRVGSKKGVTKRDLVELARKVRETLAKHAVRHIEAVRADGTPATDADIPAWCDAIPEDVALRLHDVAKNPDNFRDLGGDPAELAGKS